MSQWTHPICGTCWRSLNPDREPGAFGNPDEERCCWCGDPTTDGIYLREDPRLLPAHAEHPE